MCGLSCSEVNDLINSWIFNERDRRILYRRLIDGITMEKLGEEFDLSVSQVKRIVSRGKATLLSKCW